MTKRKGDWIKTFSGITFYPIDPRPEEIVISDIAHALSLQCRFGGHTIKHYSVAQHSVLVSRNVPQKDALWGLLHDAPEAYLVDLPRPIKNYSKMGDLYRQIEDVLMACVCKRFGLENSMPESVHRADYSVCSAEKRDLLGHDLSKPSEDLYEPIPDKIPWQAPEIAERDFLQRFLQLTINGTGFHKETPKPVHALTLDPKSPILDKPSTRKNS